MPVRALERVRPRSATCSPCTAVNVPCSGLFFGPTVVLGLAIGAAFEGSMFRLRRGYG